MVITRRQKIYLAAMCVAIAAWATDRFVFQSGMTAPRAADASSLLVSRGAAPAAATATHAAPLSLNERLDALADGGDSQVPSRDVFVPPAEWLPAEKPSTAENTHGMSADDFQASHKLTAIVLRGKASVVVMGDQTLHVGQSIDGFVLVNIQSSEALFTNGISNVMLRLQSSR